MKKKVSKKNDANKIVIIKGNSQEIDKDEKEYDQIKRILKVIQ